MKLLLLYHMGAFGCVLLLVQSLFLLWRVKLVSLGHYGMACVGAYAAALFLKVSGLYRVNENAVFLVRASVFGADILFASVTTALAAAVFFFFVRRLRDDYFAVTTLLVAEALHLFASNCSYLGGATGFEVHPLLFFRRSIGLDRLMMFAVLVAALNLLFYVACAKLDKAVVGTYIAALHDDERALEARGVDTALLRGLVFVLGSVIAGVSGALFLHFTSLIVPTDFTFANSIQVLVFVVLGSGRLGRCVCLSAIAYTAISIINIQFVDIFGDRFATFLFDWKEFLIAVMLLVSLRLSTRKVYGNGYSAQEH